MMKFNSLVGVRIDNHRVDPDTPVGNQENGHARMR